MNLPKTQNTFQVKSTGVVLMKILGHENKYPCLKKSKEYFMNGVLSSNQNLTPFLIEMEVYLHLPELLSWVQIF